MRHRRVKLGQLGTLVISLAGVVGVIWPDRAKQLAELGAAVAGLLAAIAALLTVDKVAAIKASAALGKEEDRDR